jgi:ornithine carbamoyltransferase
MTALGKDLTSILNLDAEDVQHLLDLAVRMKSDKKAFMEDLKGQTMVLVFEKPSLRTRVTFETGIFQMGGYAIYLAPGDIGLGQRESVPDAARNLSRWVDVVVARTFAHNTVLGLAEHATIPVINALSDLEHPCQALADLLTLYEHRKNLKDLHLAYIGDGNNVCNSLLLLCAITGTSMSVATPAGYDPPESFVDQARQLGQTSGAEIRILQDPAEAVKDCDAVYTDVWASMGQESESEKRKKVFSPYQVNKKLMDHAKDGALFLHCLPAHRGEEVTDEVIDSPGSVVFDQAENRLHMQKAIMHRLMAEGHRINKS